MSRLEFEVNLNAIGIFPTRIELYLFFKRFDVDCDGLLKYSEFSKALLPQDSYYGSLMNSKSPDYYQPDGGISNFGF